ncbi:hypothetical protein LLB_1957 [Legionella longbeachae D-4968]|nr:hypothetical protein LLB_1957 [Legionella longbeachae D-4968]
MKKNNLRRKKEQKGLKRATVGAYITCFRVINFSTQYNETSSCVL